MANSGGVCVPSRIESGPASRLSPHVVGEIGRDNPNGLIKQLGNPRNGACIGSRVGYGLQPLGALVLLYETGLASHLPKSKCTPGLVPTHGCMALFAISFVSSFPQFCMENQTFLPAHLGSLPRPGLFTRLLRKTFAVAVGAEGSGIWSRGSGRKLSLPVSFSQGGCSQASFTPFP